MLIKQSSDKNNKFFFEVGSIELEGHVSFGIHTSTFYYYLIFLRYCSAYFSSSSPRLIRLLFLLFYVRLFSLPYFLFISLSSMT